MPFAFDKAPLCSLCRRNADIATTPPLLRSRTLPRRRRRTLSIGILSDPLRLPVGLPAPPFSFKYFSRRLDFPEFPCNSCGILYAVTEHMNSHSFKPLSRINTEAPSTLCLCFFLHPGWVIIFSSRKSGLAHVKRSLPTTTWFRLSRA